MSGRKVISIDGVDYVKVDSCQPAEKMDGLEYKLVRGDRSGVFTGYLKDLDGTQATLLDCRRIWYWDGAASISQLAVDGTSKPENCKFPKEVSKLIVLDVIEVLDVTEKARKSIQGVKEWAS